MALVRDQNGFIMQVGVNADGSQNSDLDGGDCAARTGVLAMCGSKPDAELLPRLVKDGLLIRYPGQEERGYNLPTETSRDQLICWAAGVPFIEKLSDRMMCQDVCIHYATKGKVNADILLPDLRLFLYTVAGFPAPTHIKLLGMANLPMTIMWACYVKPDHELNQLICQLSVFDKKWMRMLVERHPDWKRNLYGYWSEWRRMSEIFNLMAKFVMEKIK